MPDGALRRTPENDLLLDFYNVNEIRRVVVPEDQANAPYREHALQHRAAPPSGGSVI